MEKQTFIKKLLAYFESQEVNLEDLQLKDGTIISVDAQGKYTKKNDAGEFVPLEDGSYELSDGSLLVIKDGVKVEDKQPAPDAQKMAAPDAPVADPNQPAISADKVSLESLNGKLDEVKSKLEELTMVLENFLSGMMDMSKQQNIEQSAIKEQFNKVKEDNEKLTNEVTNLKFSAKVIEEKTEIKNMSRKDMIKNILTQK